jgi:hypothetical protein
MAAWRKASEQALYEHAVYDRATAQLVTGSLWTTRCHANMLL